MSLIAGCASGLPATSNAPLQAEAWTVCESERDAAYRAREDLLERETIYRREQVAQTVYAHAACEIESFARMEVAQGDPDDVVASLRRARTQYTTVLTLYSEVANNGATPWNVGADAGIGRLDKLFAAKLASAPAGSTMDELVVVFEERAERANQRVVDAIQASRSFIARYPEAAKWHRQACLGLERDNVSTIAGCTPFADAR